MGNRDKLYFGTNTKMTKTIADTENFLKETSRLTADLPAESIELFVIPSYTTLDRAKAVLLEASSPIRLGAQNMCWEETGQFTGEISPIMLKEVGAEIIEIGHSERRHVFGEKDIEEGLKVKSAAGHGFIPLLCVGETKEQKDQGIANETLAIQLKIGLSSITGEQAKNLWVAYEPVWAIGVSGIPATVEYAQEKHHYIRSILIDLFGEAIGSDIPVLYGGSINNSNAEGYIVMPDIDGLFVGRSAWDASNFNTLVRAVIPLFNARKKQA